MAAVRLDFDAGGSGESLLLCLHGLGANGRVWQPFLARAPERWPGRWLAPDLRGHGGSGAADRYDIGGYAADVVSLLRSHAPNARLTIVGHSLGGVIAMALAHQRHELSIAAVFALGIKVRWSEAELQQMTALAARPPKYFGTRDEALVHYGRQSGLGARAVSAGLADRAIVAAPEGWRTAMDPAAYAVSPPNMRELLAAATCPVHLARGATDPMVSLADLKPFAAEPRDIAAAGHNAMVDAPDKMWNWVAIR